MSQYMCIVQVVLFCFLALSYFFIATRKETKWTKIFEIASLYAITLMFAFSQKVTTIMFLVFSAMVILFNLNRQKGNERRIKGFNSKR